MGRGAGGVGGWGEELQLQEDEGIHHPMRSLSGQHCTVGVVHSFRCGRVRDDMWVVVGGGLGVRG